MSVEKFSNAGIKHILPSEKLDISTRRDADQKLDMMDTLVPLDGTDPVAHTAYVGKVGNAYVSGTQEHTAVQVKDLAWSKSEDTNEFGIDARLTGGFPKEGSELARPFAQIVLAKNQDDKLLFANLSHAEKYGDVSVALMNDHYDKTVYISTGEPELSGRVFDNMQDAREDGRILAELAQNGATMSGQDRIRLRVSRPAFAASLEADKSFKDDMAAADGSVAAMSMKRGSNVSTTTAMALMSGAKSPDDPIVAGLANVDFNQLNGRFAVDIDPSAKLMEVRQSLGRDEREAMMTITAGAAAMRKGDDMFRDVRATGQVLQNVETALVSSQKADPIAISKFLTATEKVVDKSSVYIREEKEKQAQKPSGKSRVGSFLGR